jgi:hypothetical protein
MLTQQLKHIAQNFEYLVVPLLFYYGYVSAFGDIKSGRIPNKLIWLGVKIGLIWHAVYIGFLMWILRDKLMPDGIKIVEEYILEFGVNSLFGLGVGFFMWWVHLWAAGDAKLFAVFTFLVPVDFYSKFHVRWFPSFALLYNIFVCALAVVCVDFAYKLARRAAASRRSGEMREFIDRYINRKAARQYIGERWKPVLRLVLGLIFSFLITSLIRKYLGVAVEKIIPWKFTINLKDVEINESIIFLLVFLLFRPLSRLYQNLVFYYITIFSLGSYILYFIFINSSFKIVTELMHFGGMSILLLAFRKVYEFYSERINVTVVPLENLLAKTILSKKTLQKIELDDKEFFKKHFELIYADGLTEDQIAALKEWKKEDPVEISGTIPFAPCIMAGVVVTIIFRGILPLINK